MKYLTLFTPGVNETGKSNMLYRDVTDVTKHDDGTISFKTQKGVTIESCLPWRVNTGSKEELEALAESKTSTGTARAPRAGRQL